MDPELTLRKLHTLLDISNTFIQCQSVQEVVLEALMRAREKLNSQVASIFLFSKNGVVERVGINGVDKDEFPIESTWFPDERYEPGTSFSGKAAAPSRNSDFGQPEWSNNLDKYEMRDESKTAYVKKLGDLKHGISIPLNGPNRTFGTLEVLNKIDQDGKSYKNEGFSKDEFYWLAIIGMNVATAISGLRRRDELKVLTDIGQKLVEPFDNDFEPELIYESIIKQLIESSLPYKAGILRIASETDILEVVASYGTKDVSWEERFNDPRRRGQGIAGEAYETGEIKIYKRRRLSI